MRSVLLLEDDADLRALLRSALDARGLRALEASTVREAEAELARGPVDLVVVDGVLPDATGIGFIESLRARGSKLRVVFLSAYFRDLQTFARLTSELDVELVVYKPIDAEDFAARIAELLDPPAPRAVAAEAEPPSQSSFAMELAALRRQFGERLPDRVEELARAVARARDGAPADARGLAHRLRGTAGSYGYRAVGEAAGVLEDLLADAPASAAQVPRFFWERVDGALRDVQAAMHTSAATASEVAVAGLKPRTLLVVDDDPAFLQAVSALGRRLLVNVVTARTSAEALERARGERLSGALLDVHLGEEDSFSLARKLRDTVRNTELPIAFASGDQRIETLVAAAEAGGARFFQKPISDDAFGEVAKLLLDDSQPPRGRALIVDDDPEAVAQYAGWLEDAGFEVDSLGSADGLVERLELTRPDVLLLDVLLPRVSGIDVCRALRLSDRWDLLPVLVVTASSDPGTRLRAFRAGASDVVVKPALAEELVARVSVQVERTRLLHDRADKDTLTGLLLRRSFLEACERALATCTREGKPLAVVLLDIDHFKKVNDRHGHLAGDQVLARMGELLRRRFRREDLRCRWGGEEFVLAFPGQSIDFANRSAQRLRAELEALSFKSDAGESFSATFSAGVAGFPDDGATLPAILRRADELLYEGKRQGRNQVRNSGEFRAARPAPKE